MIAQFFRLGCKSGDAALLILLLEGLGTLIDIRLSPAQPAINQNGQFSRCREYRNIGPNAPRDLTVICPQGRLAVPQG